MTSISSNWTKIELQVYILLLCANADKEETQEELSMIQSKVPHETFDKVYRKFSSHSSKKRIKKIDRNIHFQNYSDLELNTFRKEIDEVFFSDGKFKMMEQRMGLLLDNMLY